MKASFQALGRHVDLSGVTPEKLSEVLPMLGLEVESIHSFGLAPLPFVVVGEIQASEKHPSADRLSVCKVDVGDTAPRVAMDMQMTKMAEKAKQQERPMKSKEVPLPPPAKENVKVETAPAVNIYNSKGIVAKL